MKLYILDNKQTLRVWEIIAHEDGYEVRHGQLGGQMQTKFTDIFEGKASRTLDEQIDLEVESKIKKRKDKGYVETIEEAKKGPTNALGLAKPMLAQPFAKVAINDEVYYAVQYKYDGHRCLITKQNGNIIAYSRNGKVIDSINHIKLELQALPEGITLDGELYVHGVPLQTISSWVRKRQEASARLEYVCYDVIDDVAYGSKTFPAVLQRTKHSYIAPTLPPTAFKRIDVATQLENALAGGYEGLILRNCSMQYETGKRSKGLIKVKQWETEEFLVVDIEDTKDGHAKLICEVPGVGTVKATAPGTHAEKIRIYHNRNVYIGRMVQLQFAFYTKAGKPFHPIATMWRNKHEE